MTHGSASSRHASAQATGQGRQEIFAENDSQFFLKVVNAQLSFDVGADGRTTGMTLHQNGIDQRAPKVAP